MRRLILLSLLAVLAVPTAASAAPVVVSPSASPVTDAGVTTVEVANTTKRVLRGTASLTVGGRKVASRSVRLPKRSVSTVRFRLAGSAVDALRAAGGRATVVLSVRRAGGRRTTARRSLTVEVPAGQGPAAAPAPAPAAGPSAPAPAASGPRKFVGRMGDEGAYDDLELTVENGQMTITKAPFVPVVCGENGGAYRSSVSLELFDAPGPWAIGTDGNVQKQGIAVNTLVNSGAKSITYKVTGTAQTADKITGKLGMSFFDSKYDLLFTNAITFINCAGEQSFEAVPA
jgi:hypothetical protein